MIGVFEKMRKENQNSSVMLEQKRRVHQKKNSILVFGTGLFILLILSAVLYWRQPAVWAEILGFFFPDEQYSLTVQIGSKEHKLPLFYKQRAHERPNGKIVPALVLCNIPTPEGLEHIKIFPDCLGVSQFPKEWFSVGRFSLMLREGARTTIPLEDDLKGWDAEYHIQRENGMFCFNIFPQSGNQEHISFSIPGKLMERVPCFEENSSQKSLPDQQIIKPYRVLEKQNSDCSAAEKPLSLFPLANQFFQALKHDFPYEAFLRNMKCRCAA